MFKTSVPIQSKQLQLSLEYNTCLAMDGWRDTWWRHQMETFSAWLAICAGNSPGTGEFPAQRPVRRSFDVFFDLPTNKRLSKQWWGWWFGTLSSPLWRHCNEICLKRKLQMETAPQLTLSLPGKLWHLGLDQRLISMALCKIAVSLLLMHWSYCSLALSHRYDQGNM